jgi:hypothetical protein
MSINVLTTEKQFQQQVKDLAKILGWKYYHTWRSFHSPAGFPDCVMVKGCRVIFAELKTEKGKVSEKQQEWITALSGTNNETYVWRPSDWDDIVEVLRGAADA